jgi:hypothetical protein
MFVPIRPRELVHGTKYKIIDLNDPFLKFIEFYKIGTFVRIAYKFKGVWYYLFHVNGKKKFFASNCMFYKFVSENPQEKMEQRALDKILKQLINDDFTW